MTGILRASQEDGRHLPYLLIGGHAVSLLGVPRNTYDLDLMIPEGSLADWESFLLKSLGLVPYFRSDSFVQFKGNDQIPPIDLMIVTAETFEKLRSDSEEKTLDGIRVSVPSARHLVALKLHAIQQPKRKLKEKDWGDVVSLIVSCKLNLDSDDFRAIIRRYGGPDAECEIRRRLSQGG